MLSTANDLFVTTEANYHRDRAVSEARSAALARKARATHRRAARIRRRRNAIVAALHTR
jgi:hypothetical protein